MLILGCCGRTGPKIFSPDTSLEIGLSHAKHSQKYKVLAKYRAKPSINPYHMLQENISKTEIGLKEHCSVISNVRVFVT